MVDLVTSLLSGFLITALFWIGYADVQCDFNDGDICPGWNQGLDNVIDEFEWSVGFSKGHLEESGNSTNLTKIGDYFFYMATTDQSPNDRAVFATPVMTSSRGNVTINFLYCMFGDHTQSLSVFIKDMSLVSSESEIWSRDGKDAAEWTAVNKVANVTGPFLVIFQGKMGKGSAAIAVDDILIENADVLSTEDGMKALLETTTKNTDGGATSFTGISRPETTTFKLITTTDSNLLDYETLPLIIAAAGGVLFWLGVLFMITYITCKRQRKNKRRVKQANNTLQRKLAKASNEIEVNYAPRRQEEIKIYRIPDTISINNDHIYHNQIPSLYNYDPLNCDPERYGQCSNVHDYATIS